MGEEKIRALLDEFVAKRSESEGETSKDDTGTENSGSTESETAPEEPAPEPTEDFESVVDTDAPEASGDSGDGEVTVSKIYKREIGVNEKFKKIYDALDAAGAYAYVIDMFDSYFIYDEYEVGTFKQYYFFNDSDEVVFEGEPIKVYAQFLTGEEVAALDEMRANYSKIKTENEELTAYKAKVETDLRNSEVEKVFSAFDKDLGEFEEYQNLKDNCSDLSIDDIKMRCFAIKGMKITTFSGTKKSSSIVVGIDSKGEDCGANEPYGGLFKKYNI